MKNPIAVPSTLDVMIQKANEGSPSPRSQSWISIDLKEVKRNIGVSPLGVIKNPIFEVSDGTQPTITHPPKPS